jgi:hypothetical protein
MATKKKMPARGSKRVRRFDEGGYTGDDPIVKYRMGQLSEADTYDAMGLKDLANASRAKEPKVMPSARESRTDNFYGTSSPEEISNASFPSRSTSSEETITKTPVKTTVRREVVAPKPVGERTTDANRYKDLTDQNDRRLKQVQVSYEDQNDRRLKQAKPVASSTDNNKLSMEDMKKSIGFDSSNASDLMPGGAALRSLKNLSSNIIKNKAVKKAEEEALSGGFSYADKLAREAKRPPDLIDYLVGKKAEARDYILNKLPRNSVANKTRKFEESGAMPGEFNASEMRPGFKKGGKVKAFKQGGSVKSEPTRSSASKRADGCAIKGHTRGKYN